jgi:hypothetical protein
MPVTTLRKAYIVLFIALALLTATEDDEPLDEAAL